MRSSTYKSGLVLMILVLLSTAYAQEKAPTFYLPTLKGDNFFASELYGEQAKEPKVSVISFSASWCAPCQKEIRALDSLSIIFPEIGFYLIDYKEKKEVVQKWKNRLQTNIPILLDIYGLTAKKFGMAQSGESGNITVTLPTLFVMNKRGEIIYTHSGYEDKYAKTLKELLKTQQNLE